MIRRPPRPTLFPYTPPFRSPEHPRERDLRQAALRLRIAPADIGMHAREPHLHAVPRTVLRQFRRAHPPVRPEKRPLLVDRDRIDRKSTRLNSSHVNISYAVF